MMFSYFPYAAAFATPEGEPVRIQVGLVMIGIVVAPFVFIVLGFVSRYPDAPKRILWAMLLLLLLGLSVGLLSPVAGAVAGFGVGGALTLYPLDAHGYLRWRIWSVVFSVFYVMVLLVAIPPAGVFTGGLMPLIMVGFADEYVLWRSKRDAVTPPAAG